jgi:hypothetical protein
MVLFSFSFVGTDIQFFLYSSSLLLFCCADKQGRVRKVYKQQLELKERAGILFVVLFFRDVGFFTAEFIYSMM